MDANLKYHLIEKIVQTNNETLLQEIKGLLEAAPGELREQMSDAEQKSVERGIKQADRGEFIPHEQAWAQISANRKKRG